VFICHTISGRTLIEPLANGTVRHRRYQTGREGIVAIAKAMDSIRALTELIFREFLQAGMKISKSPEVVRSRSRSLFL
jgi:hypothetical protein